MPCCSLLCLALLCRALLYCVAWHRVASRHVGSCWVGLGRLLHDMYVCKRVDDRQYMCAACVHIYIHKNTMYAYMPLSIGTIIYTHTYTHTHIHTHTHTLHQYHACMIVCCFVRGYLDLPAFREAESAVQFLVDTPLCDSSGLLRRLCETLFRLLSRWCIILSCSWH